MAQKTAKTVLDVLQWISTTPHYRGSWMTNPGFFVLSNRRDKLRIPAAVQTDASIYMTASGRMDRRMYIPNAKGRALLAKAARAEAAEGPTVAL